MSKSKRKRAPKTVLLLPDLEQSRSAVMNSLTAQSSQRSDDHEIPAEQSGIGGFLVRQAA